MFKIKIITKPPITLLLNRNWFLIINFKRYNRKTITKNLVHKCILKRIKKTLIAVYLNYFLTHQDSRIRRISIKKMKIKNKKNHLIIVIIRNKIKIWYNPRYLGIIIPVNRNEMSQGLRVVEILQVIHSQNIKIIPVLSVKIVLF